MLLLVLTLQKTNLRNLHFFIDPATHLGLTSGTDSHWGSYNSSYASYLGQTQAASFNSSTAALSAYGSAVAGANTATGDVGAVSATSGEHGSASAQIPTGKDKNLPY